MARLTKARRYVIGSMALLIAGCAASGLNSKPVAPRFYGIWSYADAGTINWLEIDAKHIVGYGSTQLNARCTVIPIDVAARDRIVLPVSSIGAGPMSLTLNGTALVLTGKYATQRYAPVSRDTICRGSAGKYLPGAPYPK
jgi:hypothetical protein